MVHELSGNVVPVFRFSLEESDHDGCVVVSLLLEFGLFRAVVQVLELVCLLPIGGIDSHPGLKSGRVGSAGADVRIDGVDLAKVLVALSELGCEIVSREEQGPAILES